jgi:hypothetical protein
MLASARALRSMLSVPGSQGAANSSGDDDDDDDDGDLCI